MVYVVIRHSVKKYRCIKVAYILYLKCQKHDIFRKLKKQTFKFQCMKLTKTIKAKKEKHLKNIYFKNSFRARCNLYNTELIRN